MSKWRDVVEKIEDVLYKHKIMITSIEYTEDSKGRIEKVRIDFRKNDDKILEDIIPVVISIEVLGKVVFSLETFNHDIDYKMLFYTSHSRSKAYFKFTIINDDEYFGLPFELENLDAEEEIIKRKFAFVIKKIKDREKTELLESLEKAFKEAHEIVKEFLLEQKS